MNWDRQYRILAGVPGSEGFEIGNPAMGRPLHVTFSFEKADTESSNTGSLSIDNLNDEHKAVLKEKNCVIEIRAGYGDVIGPIFLGGVKETQEEINGGDRTTSIELIDGLLEYGSIGSVSMNGVISCYTALQAASDGLGVYSSIITPQAEEMLNSARYDNGYCYVGKWRSALQAICQKAGVTFTMQNGVLQVYVPGEAITSVAYVISKDTGLISIPKKITISGGGKSSSSSKSKKSSGSSDDSNGTPGYEIDYMINPAIGVNDLVKVKSKDLTGFFRVKSQNYSGDNYSGDWKCTAQIVEVTV